jgi:hypothetical protein
MSSPKAGSLEKIKLMRDRYSKSQAIFRKNDSRLIEEQTEAVIASKQKYLEEHKSTRVERKAICKHSVCSKCKQEKTPKHFHLLRGVRERVCIMCKIAARTKGK